MSTPAVYRFLPWSRRGLIAEARESAAAAEGPLPVRAGIQLAVTLSVGGPPSTTSATVAGPGDVVGLDPSVIVRLAPRPNTSNAEPSYLAAVDFEAPDLPWLLTPSAANPVGQLRPWIVLVVVERRPGVDISVPPGAPLPQLHIASGAMRELPSLVGSWAWAHSQLIVEQGSGMNAADLSADPDRNVSRLLCPRRLRPGARWLACLVPAFDAGVRRGVGQTPDGDTLAPAWTDQDSVTLPVYFHWEFGTGAEGDFESLARRLQPFRATSESEEPVVGTVKMHIGAAGGPVDLAENHPGRIVDMDGALRALGQDDGRLEEVPAQLRTPLGRLLNSVADPRGTGPDDGAVGPPLYGAWHANRFAVAASDTGWFAELNLDPRARVAAGLGAEVVRDRQEDLVAACWDQVGAVLAANALLSRSALSVAASRRLHTRTILRLGQDRLLSYAAGLGPRTPFRSVTVRSAITPTSMPDSVVDPAMRRFSAPTNRFVGKAARRANVAPHLVGRRLVTTLSAGTPAVDPTRFVPAGIAPPAGGDLVAGTDGMVDLSPIGLPFRRPSQEADVLRQGIKRVRGAPVPPAKNRLILRENLRQTGLITKRPITVLRDVVTAAPPQDRVALVTRGLSDLSAASLRQPGAAGFILLGDAPAGPEGLPFRALDVTSKNEIVLRTGPTEGNEVLGRIEGPVRGEAARRVVTDLPPGALQPGRPPPTLRPGPSPGAVVVVRLRVAPPLRPPGGTVVRPPVGPPILPPVRPPFTFPPPVRDATVISRFEQAVGRIGEVSTLADAAPQTAVVAFDLAAATSALRNRCHPDVAHVVRVGTLLRFGPLAFGDLRAGTRIDGLVVSPVADRIMAYPELLEPAYRLLARYDRDRLLPGVDAIPPDSVTLLETNPRFVAGFLAGLNHELNRELLWRRYPTDQRGTPMRRFWEYEDGRTDIEPIHGWNLTRALVAQAGGESNLVLLVRGELLRRYPNTVVLAIAASSPNTPSTREEDVRRPIFAGFLAPDITFFGFDLEDDDLTVGNGWFFALQEQVTEPRFGLDETVGAGVPASGPTQWRSAAWPHTGIASGSTFTVDTLRTLASSRGLSPVPTNGANMADALFQHPVQVVVHARNIT